LTLSYPGAIPVTITISAADEHALKMQASITNSTGAEISGFSFPNDLRVTAADVQDALLPMMPGALLNASYFAKGVSYVNEYPGGMFADYLALRSTKGNLALYSQKGDILQPVLIGYERADKDSPFTKLTHRYRTWILDGNTWTSPQVVIRVGQGYKESALAYRTDNGIDQYKSLKTKLGSKAAAYFAAPMYKLDLAVLKLPFKDLKGAVVDKLKFPGIVHFVVLGRGGFDNQYPDFIPPDPKWGTTEEFADLVREIHAKNGLVIPYTNFSWWDNNGTTMTSLPADLPMTDIIAAGTGGAIIIEKYGPNAGFVMNLHHPFVKAKINEQHAALMKTIGVDGIFGFLRISGEHATPPMISRRRVWKSTIRRPPILRAC
jgi:hypothetical protein